MESRKIAPYRRLPARIRTSLQYLEYSISVEHGCGRSSFARELDQDEYRTRRAALGCLQGYLLGEQDHQDVEIRETPDEMELSAEDMLAMFAGPEQPTKEQPDA